MEKYQSNAIVMQCGADSLSGDRLGCFNLTLKGHGKCVEFMTKWNLPILLLGGGGYNKRNVARCWTYETSVVLGQELANELPYNDYYEYYGPDSNFTSNMANKNTPVYLDKTKTQLFQNLMELPHAPGVQMQDIPEDAINSESDEEDKVIQMRDFQVQGATSVSNAVRNCQTLKMKQGKKNDVYIIPVLSQDQNATSR